MKNEVASAISETRAFYDWLNALNAPDLFVPKSSLTFPPQIPFLSDLAAPSIVLKISMCLTVALPIV